MNLIKVFLATVCKINCYHQGAVFYQWACQILYPYSYLVSLTIIIIIIKNLKGWRQSTNPLWAYVRKGTRHKTAKSNNWWPHVARGHLQSMNMGCFRCYCYSQTFWEMFFKLLLCKMLLKLKVFQNFEAKYRVLWLLIAY